MKLPDTLRPGIYTQMTVTPLYTTPRGRLHCGLVAGAKSHLTEKIALENYREASSLFSDPQDRPLLRILAVLFTQGVAGVCVVPVANTQGEEAELEAYSSAFAMLENEENLGVILCDSEDGQVLQALKTTVMNAAENQRERLGVAAVSQVQNATTIAKALNCERMLLCCGSAKADGVTSPIHLAAAISGTILAADDPSLNLNGATMEGVQGLEQVLTNTQVEALLQAGVTPFEELHGQVECIRAVTTRTLTDGLADATYRSVNTVLIIDYVMATLRATLRARLRGSKNNPQTRESIRSQVTVELSQAVEEGLLEEYSTPRVYPHADDPSVCVVEVAFTVAQVINQIVIVAQIRV